MNAIKSCDVASAGERPCGPRALHFALEALEKVGPAIRMFAFDQPALGMVIEDALHDIAVETHDPINRAEGIAIAFADENTVPLHRHVFDDLQRRQEAGD